jgi:uncharacterized protein (TIGR02246 family)
MSSASALPTIETALQHFASTFATAWNRHDAKGLADLFTEDADLIDPSGQSAEGRSAIEKLLGYQHSNALKNTQMNQIVMRIRVLAPDLAISTNRCEISGMPSIGGRPAPGDTIVTMVMKNQGGTWRILTGRPMVPVPRLG